MQKALNWAKRGTAAAAIKAAHIIGALTDGDHDWTTDPANASLIDGMKNQDMEAQFLREASKRSERAGWPTAVTERLLEIAETVLNDRSAGVGLRSYTEGGDGESQDGARETGISDSPLKPMERLSFRARSVLHVSENFEHREIISARDHRHAALQARALEEQGVDGALRAARVYERMAECGYPWEADREQAKALSKADRRAQGYSVFAAAFRAAGDGRSAEDLKRLSSLAYGILTAAGEPERQPSIALWPDGAEDARFNLTLARCYVLLGRHEEAERRAERAIRQKLLDAPYLSNQDRAAIETLGMRLVREAGISGIDCPA